MLSKNYLKAIKTLLKATFNRCIEDEIIFKDPLFNFKLPQTNEKCPTDRIITEEDLKKLINAVAKHKRLKFVISILLLTGMRIGELLALKWQDINFEENIIYIRHSVNKQYVEERGQIKSCGVKIASTKTRSSVRELPVCDLVMSLLLEWNDCLNTDYPKMEELKKKNDTQDVIFVNYHGNIMCYNTLYKELVGFLDDNHLKHCGVLFHKLRHCYATHMVDAGIDINVISKLLGHANISTTAAYYAKVNLKPKIKAVKIHAKYMSNVINM
ncbi:MAG: site-specific integrase [Oscillospiraceae bacterium]